jgi:hypothetical protein
LLARAIPLDAQALARNRDHAALEELTAERLDHHAIASLELRCPAPQALVVRVSAAHDQRPEDDCDGPDARGHTAQNAARSGGSSGARATELSRFWHFVLRCFADGEDRRCSVEASITP